MQRSGKYVVQAQITLYNELIFFSPGTHPVMNDPAFQRVDVVLEPYVRSKATARAAVAFEHTHWQLLGVGEDVTTGVAPPAEGAAPAFVRFQPVEAGEAASRGEFAGSGGCNRFLGSYERRGTDLRLKLGTTSIRLCLAGGGDEPAYLSALTQVRSFEQNARELTLLDQDGKALLHFRAAEAGKAAFEPYEPPNSQQ
ncbi:hypothetical protein SDC9_85213 [bioreactor metagenome]|uniref:DUF306 domain-containing protein n=1 Tax=bioreactor metagenome TaxID=1076179 RepID=A0A644ZLF3_9ZZZZ